MFTLISFSSINFSLFLLYSEVLRISTRLFDHLNFISFFLWLLLLIIPSWTILTYNLSIKSVLTSFSYFIAIAILIIIRVYESSSVRRTVLFSIIVALYAVTIPFCYHTAGEPRAAAMLHAQKLGKYVHLTYIYLCVCLFMYVLTFIFVVLCRWYFCVNLLSVIFDLL